MLFALGLTIIVFVVVFFLCFVGLTFLVVIAGYDELGNITRVTVISLIVALPFSVAVFLLTL